MFRISRFWVFFSLSIAGKVAWREYFIAVQFRGFMACYYGFYNQFGENKKVIEQKFKPLC